MEPDDLLCSRKARPPKMWRKGVRTFLCFRSARLRRMRGGRQPSFLLAEPPRYSGGRLMRAVKDGLPIPSGKVEESEGPRSTAAVKSSLRPCLAGH